MDILRVEPFGPEELLARLKQTRLKGFDQPLVYGDASLELMQGVDTDRLVPAQRYVLKPNVRRTHDLRAALLDKDIDIFALEGGALFWADGIDEEEGIPILPPVVEESQEPSGETVWLINDGMHRVYAAREAGLPITVVLARNVPSQFPYYAYALSGGWDDVTAFEDLPDSFEKKTYRSPDNYKALFRNFNAIFPNVQVQRKQTNPEHLRR